MEFAWYNPKEGGGRTGSVHNFLSSSGPGSINFWGRDLGLVGGNLPKSGWSASWLPKADNGA